MSLRAYELITNMDYKKTLNLPKTDFPMKANLAQNEPKIMSRWKEVYAAVGKKNKGKGKYILHDGPPYANGFIHIGHAFNKILKDIIVKFKLMNGYSSEYVPGWDCHGLPVEHQLLKELKKSKHQVDVVDFRKKARDYALKYVRLQKDDFIRLGIFGDWEHPYLTVNPEYEAKVLEVLLKLAERGYLYRNLKPVNWCMRCETALAEAEIEYDDEESFSLYCTFELKEKDFLKGIDTDKKVYFLVWTTTPWTLVSNVAVAVHPEYTYVLAEWKDGYVIFLKELAAALEEKGLSPVKVIREYKGKDLERLHALHPFIEREALVVNAGFVVKEEGSGCVHIAPGHGAEDYQVAQQYHLPVLMSVDDKGVFTPEAGACAGMNVSDAQEKIIEILKANHRLVYVEKITHSYPFCWRCKSPIIVRSTYQWFLNVEHDELRKRLLDHTGRIGWYPSSGKERMRSMLAVRPDWCLSRQRLWGVPIPALRCKKCAHVALEPAVIKAFITKVREKGSDAWFEENTDAFVPEGYRCPHCKNEGFEKETDILDVWFESGSSFAGVLKIRDELGFPADLYLEGSDQHRGWFQVSFILSLSTEDEPSFRSILTHGFVVDGEGRKMSKSLGNVVAPQEIVKKYGADILRLWVASSDYQEDVRISDEIVGQLVEQYRKIRNTVRFLLSNIYDFNVAEHAVATPLLQALDTYMLKKAQDLFQDVTVCYERFEFYKVVQKIYAFCNIDLSSFYMDILKDTLYTHYHNSPKRRSAQTVLYYVVQLLMNAISPILSFTAEEAYRHFDRTEQDTSVFLGDWAIPFSLPEDAQQETQWARLFALREKTLKELENARSNGIIGTSLEARLVIQCAGHADYEFFSKRTDMLKELCIVSQVEVVASSHEDAVVVTKARGRKCERCWMFIEEKEDARYQGLCAKCIDVVKTLGKEE